MNDEECNKRVTKAGTWSEASQEIWNELKKLGLDEQPNKPLTEDEHP